LCYLSSFIYRKKIQDPNALATTQKDDPSDSSINSETSLYTKPKSSLIISRKFPDRGTAPPTPPESLMNIRYNPNFILTDYPKSIFSSYSKYIKSSSDQNLKIAEMFKEAVPDIIIYISRGAENLEHLMDLCKFLYLPTDVYFTAMSSYKPKLTDELQIDLGDDLMTLQHNFDGWCLGYNRRTKEEGIFFLVHIVFILISLILCIINLQNLLQFYTDLLN
jgi:hypothetical protein